VPLSVVCFRWRPSGAQASAIELDSANQQLVDRVNATGEVFLATARLNGQLIIRMAIGHLRTNERHVRRAWDLLVELSGSGGRA
jgi:aromatic-L-amino-acid decarboxylase